METASKFQTKEPVHNSSEDIEPITRLVANMEKAHNQKTPEEFAQLFAEDAVFVNAAGVRLLGREQIYESAKKVMQGALAKSYARYEVMGIRFIRPDVSIADIRQYPITQEGDILEGQAGGIPTFVLAREQGNWTIVSGQNTLVPASIS